jgi:hypothetical protein
MARVPASLALGVRRAGPRRSAPLLLAAEVAARVLVVEADKWSSDNAFPLD